MAAFFFEGGNMSKIMSDVERVEWAQALLRAMDNASSQCTHYPNSSAKRKKLDRAAAKLFMAIIGRKPTPDEIEGCLV